MTQESSEQGSLPRPDTPLLDKLQQVCHLLSMVAEPEAPWSTPFYLFLAALTLPTKVRRSLLEEWGRVPEGMMVLEQVSEVRAGLLAYFEEK